MGRTRVVAAQALLRAGMCAALAMSDFGAPVAHATGPGFDAAALSYETRSNPGPPVVADFDADGRPDVAVCASGRAMVLLGRGDGTLRPGSNYACGGGNVLAKADLDGDGRTDLVVLAGNSVAVLIGQAGGSFSAPREFVLPGAPTASATAIAIGDLNGDARPDLAVTGLGYLVPYAVTVLLAAGDGTFVPAGSWPVGEGPKSLALADLNGDSRLDVVASNSHSASLTMRFGNGDGTFGERIDMPTPFAPGQVALCDLDEDGAIDIAVTCRIQITGAVAVFRGHGDGSFAPREDLAAGGPADAFAVADLNGDGALDLVVSSEVEAGFTILPGSAAGGFGAAIPVPVGVFSGYVVVAVFEGDGAGDLVGVQRSFDSVCIVHGHGDFTFGAKREYATGTRPEAIALGDLNRDGHLDFIVADGFASGLQLGWGAGDGTFGPVENLFVGDMQGGLALGDVNGDGWLDAAVTWGLYPGSLTLLLGAPGDTLLRGESYELGERSGVVALADLDGDGVLDVAVAHQWSDYVSVQFGRGDGTFTYPPLLASIVAPGAIVARDFDGDGRADVLATSGAYPGIGLLRGGAVTGFEPLVWSATQAYSTWTWLTCGDLDGDGDADLVLSNPWSSVDEVDIVRNLGHGVFGDASQCPTERGVRATVVADLSGDGRADLVVTNDAGNSISVFHGLGNGAFDPPTGYIVGMTPRAVAVGDVDEDGWPDLLVANNLGSSVSVLLNRMSAAELSVEGDATASHDRPLLAFPNPGVADIRVGFTLPAGAQVRADVLDVAGRRVRQLLRSERLAPGEHTLTWDRADDRGATVRPGLYFIRLHAGDHVAVARATVTR